MSPTHFMDIKKRASLIQDALYSSPTLPGFIKPETGVL